jgi:hypothetical protein
LRAIGWLSRLPWYTFLQIPVLGYTKVQNSDFFQIFRENGAKYDRNFLCEIVEPKFQEIVNRLKSAI